MNNYEIVRLTIKSSLEVSRRLITIVFHNRRFFRQFYAKASLGR